MELILFWIGLAIIVGVAANTRGRNGVGWFLLGMFVISPLLAGLLLFALPQKVTAKANISNQVNIKTPAEFITTLMETTGNGAGTTFIMSDRAFRIATIILVMMMLFFLAKIMH